jgi:type IX secretion system PorP/SprF family membrane protein
MMTKLKLLIAFVLVGVYSYGQQDAMYTHYTFNHLAVNPAYAGSREVVSLTALHRSQWVGFAGAPQTQTFAIHAPTFNKSVGLGLSVVNDKIGPTSLTSFYADFAYRLKLTKTTIMSFGIKGGGGLMSVNLGSVATKEVDSKFTSTNSAFLPNIGAGLYVYNAKWYAGISAPKLVQNNYNKVVIGNTLGEQRHYFLIAGFVMNLSNTVKLKPSTYVKATEAAPLNVDLTAMFILKDKLELGVMGRTGDAAGMLIGYNFSPRFRIGYSFDWSFTNTTGTYNAGSHEVMLRYEFSGANKENIHSPRYF